MALIATNQSQTTEIYVNQQVISARQILAEMQYHPAQNQREAMCQAAESLIISELVRQRARQLGLLVGDDSSDTTDETFIEALIANEVEIPVATEEECAHYYHAKPQRFMSSPLLEVRHILLAAAPDDEAGRIENKRKSEILLNALRAGEDFSLLASAESACPSKTVGGSLGQISRGQTVPEFERPVFLADPGLLPRAVESRYGFHLVFIERKVDGVQLPFDAVKETIANYLNEKVRMKAIAQYIQTLIVAAEISGYDFSVSNSPLMQ